MAGIYYVDARGERVPDGDPRAAYLINPNDAGAAGLLERLQKAASGPTAQAIEGIKAVRPLVAEASGRHKEAAERIHRIAAENRRTREAAAADDTANAEPDEVAPEAPEATEPETEPERTVLPSAPEPRRIGGRRRDA